MANESFSDGVRLLFQPLETPVLLAAPTLNSTAVQQLSLSGVPRTAYYAVEIMVYLQPTADANVSLTLFGTGLSESTGQVVQARKGTKVTRRMRLVVGSRKQLSAKLTAPCTDCWIRVVGTWN